MLVQVLLRKGPDGSEAVTKSDMQKNINSLVRAIKGEELTPHDLISLNDTKSILEGIQKNLPKSW